MVEYPTFSSFRDARTHQSQAAIHVECLGPHLFPGLLDLSGGGTWNTPTLLLSFIIFGGDYCCFWIEVRFLIENMEKKLPYLGKKLPYFGYRLPRFKGRPLYLVGVRVRVRVWSRRKSPCAGKITWVMVVFLPFFTQKKFLNIWKKVTLFGKKITVCRYRSPLQGPLYLVGLRVSSR